MESCSTSVRVLVRGRPASTGDQPLVWALLPEQGAVCSAAANKEFRFDSGLVFGSTCTHKQLFEEGLDESASATLLRGTDVALLSYGYPGSGKSFTLFGTPGQSRTRPEARGLAARIGAQLFDKIQSCECKGKRFRVTVSFYHVFEDGRVADLLDGRKRSLRVVGSTAEGYVVEGATSTVVTSPAEVVHAIERGVLMRNATGSERDPAPSGEAILPPKGAPRQTVAGSGPVRSHATHGIFMVCIEQLSATGDAAMVSRLMVIDLSGSAIEKCHRSPHLLKEGSSILTLHSVLHSLHSGDSEEKLAEVAARSVFTKILQHCFDRKSCLFFLAAIHTDSIDSTLPALQLAAELQRAKLAPEKRRAAAEATAVWKHWKSACDAREELQRKLGVEEGGSMEVQANGTLLLNGTVLEDITASCKDLCSAVASAEGSLVVGGKPLTASSRVPQPPVAPPLGSLLLKPPLPLASLPVMNRQGGPPPRGLSGLPGSGLGGGFNKPLPLGQLPFGGILPRPPVRLAPTNSPFPPMLPSAPSLVHQEGGQERVQLEEKAELLSSQRASKAAGTGEGPVKRKKRRKRSSTHSSGRNTSSEEQGDSLDLPKRSRTPTAEGTLSHHPALPQSVGVSREDSSCSERVHLQLTLPPSTATQANEEREKRPVEERLNTANLTRDTTLEHETTKRSPPHEAAKTESSASSVPSAHSPNLELEPEAQSKLKDRDPPVLTPGYTTEGPASLLATEQQSTSQPSPHEVPSEPLQPEEEPVAASEPLQPEEEPVAASEPLQPEEEPVAASEPLQPEEEPIAASEPLQPEEEPVAASEPLQPEEEPIAASEPLQPEEEPVAASYLSPVDPSASLSAQLARQTLAPVASAGESGTQPGLGTPGQGSSCPDVGEQAERTLAQQPDIPSQDDVPQLQHSSEREGECLFPPAPADVLHQEGPSGIEELQTESAVSISRRSGSAVSVVSADDEAPTESLAQPALSEPHQTGRHPVCSPLTQKVASRPMAPRNLLPVQPVNMTHLPPARNRLAPIHHVTPRDPPPSTVNIYSAHTELSDSLSSLGSESEDELTQSGVAHTLKLPQHQRMSLGRPSLPPIPSESGNGTVPAEFHTQRRVSYGYIGVEPPRYDQVARGSGQEPQSSHGGGVSANPPTYNMDEAHSSGLRSDPSSEAVGDHFRESQQFASSVEIHTAAMEGVKSSTMKKLVFQYGVEYRDQGGRTPLMYAVLGNQPKMCEVLLQLGANVNTTDAAGLTPLLWAAYRARAQAMKVLLRHEADVLKTDPENRTAYHWSMKTADTQCIKLLCKYVSGGVQNKTDNEGLTPLHWAVMCDQDSHIHIFLSSTQVDAAAQDPNGRTPLNYAILNFSPNCIKAILDHAEEVVNLRDGKGRAALHYACAEGSVDCIRTLLAYKSCNLHCTDYQGTTPLHWAAAANQPSVLQLLLRRGSDRNQLDKRGMTALNHAQQRGYLECIQILETYGLKRLPSNISIASQFQVPPSQPAPVDEYGHVPLHRPPGGGSLITSSQLFDRGTADGNDRESRPGSALDHLAGPSGAGTSNGQPEPPEAGCSSGSVSDTGPSSSRPAVERSSSARGARQRGGWLSLLCGSSSADTVSGPILCGRRNTAVAPMQQEVVPTNTL